MSQVEIIAVKSKSDKRKFVQLKYDLYRSDPFFIPMLRINEEEILDADKHPFYKKTSLKLYLARLAGKYAGRIATIYRHGSQTGYFGFLEAVNNLEVFKALIEQVKIDLQDLGVKTILGPVNPSINYSIGLLVNNFDSFPYLMLPHNPAFYKIHLETLGFNKAKDFFTYRAPKEAISMPAKIAKIALHLESKHKVKLHNPDMNNYDLEVEKLFQVYNSSMAKHWGFLPMDRQEFGHLADGLKMLIDPDFVFIAEIDDQPIGYIMCVPNYNEVFKKISNGRLLPTGIFKLLWHRRKIQGLRVVILGVAQEWQHSGLGSVLYYHTIRNFLKSKYQEVEFSWVVEDNTPVVKISALIGARPGKTYRVYSLNLDAKNNSSA